MNPEIIRAIPKKLVTDPETLGRICWNLTNRLTGSRWVSDDVRRAHFSRSVSDVMGMPRTAKEAEKMKTAPAKNDTHVTFRARKRVVEGIHGNFADSDEYMFSIKAGQTIEHEEIPSNVLEDIFDIYDIGSEFDGAEDYEDEDEDESSEQKDVAELIRDGVLDDVEITRQQNIKYKIAGSGEILKYSLSYRYLFDGARMYETRYRSDEATKGMSPIVVGDNLEVVEKRPPILALLNEHNIESEIREIDGELASFAENMPLRELVTLSEKSQHEHRQQALAIVGLLTSGMYGLHSLAARS